MGTTTRTKRTPKAGVAQIRENLSKYLARVKRGERIEITEHGRAVALLAPLPAPRESWLE